MFYNRGLLISFGLAAVITLIYVLSNKNMEENEKNEENGNNKLTPAVGIFSVIFVVIYMISVLILDGNDNTAVYNNIKVGEPPF
jgi:hypothetical protein